MAKHFIDLDKIPADQLKAIITLAKKLKAFDKFEASRLLFLKNLVMIFEKSSTRTRISFEAGINQLGGRAIVMNRNDMQLGKGETVHDTAKVLSGLVDIAMIRCKEHKMLLDMADSSSIPIINGLSDYSHPCQIMSAILTFEEAFNSSIKGKKLAWMGDANNVLNSYIHAALAFDYQLDIAIPEAFDFSNQEIARAKSKGARINLYHNPEQAVANADVIITDTWFSMGQISAEDKKAKDDKLKLLSGYQVNQSLMKLAKPTAIFSHCLPAYRGFEVTKEVIDGKQSMVFLESNNRLHAQKAIMLWLMDIKL